MPFCCEGHLGCMTQKTLIEDDVNVFNTVKLKLNTNYFNSIGEIRII